MWHLVLAMLQACLAWCFEMCGQPDSQCSDGVKVAQDRFAFLFGSGFFGLIEIFLLSWWKHGTGGSMHLVCLLGQLQIFRDHWDLSIECLCTESPV